eukprot:TRINITY_DN36996_c0_g1_i1.p1 TRINITY_DN36996_c0_g1~~TRINITY_DN36996_c0_g1_i1.p1  ORF type:complete len:483 (-),score=83.95 TRINITY_DN36996_c0_g1_i1:181-1629(-)
MKDALLLIVAAIFSTRAVSLESLDDNPLFVDDECNDNTSADCTLNALQRRGSMLQSRTGGDQDISLKIESLEMDSFGDNPSNETLWKKFHFFCATHDRKYGKAEMARRFENFKKSFKRAQHKNHKNDGVHAFGINSFADFDANELPAKGLIVSDITKETAESLGTAPVVDSNNNTLVMKPQPAAIDWRLTKAITPVKNQGACGACWAFASAQEVESMHVLWTAGGQESGIQEIFSPQQLASCANTAAGCGGGNPVNAFEYLMKSPYGLAQEEFWPYEGGFLPKDRCRAHYCTKKCHRDLSDIVTYQHIIGPRGVVRTAMWATPLCEIGTGCRDQNLEMLRRVLVDLGPVTVAVNSRAWYSYKSGVLTEKGCGGSAWSDLEHAVQLTGYNTNEELPYWIVRNQWSTSWGMHGYIHLEYGKNTCGIGNMAAFPVVKNMPRELILNLGTEISLSQQETEQELRQAKERFLYYQKQATGELPVDTF